MRIELEQRPNPENGSLRLAHPAELMRDNPAALIVNKESYDRMAAHFTYGPNGQFDPPQIVKVIAFSSEHGEVIKDFVLDGMTRTKFVYDNVSNPAVIPSDFKFIIKDVTAAVLQNPAIVPPEERNGHQALTMLQYLRAVVPPTIEHSAIVDDRIAAHLINAWENMVGPEIAEKFSALAALSFLQNPRVPTATNEMLRKHLMTQDRLMEGESLEQRVKLQQKLIEMASIIREAKRFSEQIARAAFGLVGERSPIIGGEKEAVKQIHGLIHTVEVDDKLKEAFPGKERDTIREQIRDQIGKYLLDSFARFSDAPNRQEIYRVLGDALKDPNLNFNYVIDVFTSGNPIARYDEARQEINRDKLLRSYSTSQRKDRLSEEETKLVENIGSKTYLSSMELPSIERAIRGATETLQHATSLRNKIAADSGELIDQGVNPATLTEIEQKLPKLCEELLSSDTLQKVSDKARTLSDTLTRAQVEMSRQISVHRTGEIIDAISGEKLTEGYGPQIRADIIGLILGEFGVINSSNETKVYIRAKELVSLDPDLLLGIRRGEFRREVALQKQKEREILKTEPVELPATQPSLEGLLEESPPAAPTVRYRLAVKDEGTKTLPVVEPPIRPQEPEGTVDFSKLEEKRKQTNRDNLNLLLDSLNRRLNDVDLSAEDITDNERQRINIIIRRLGQLAYDRPNVPEIITKEYPRLTERVKKLQEELIYRNIEDTQRDTRTKQ